MNSQVATKPARPVPTVSPGGELKKDPVCGTYVSADTSVTKRINGQTVHFCSPACRDKYRAAS
jgi:YHS domain-containing protein